VLTSTSSRGMRRGRRASSEGVNLQFFSERETQPECLLWQSPIGENDDYDNENSLISQFAEKSAIGPTSNTIGTWRPVDARVRKKETYKFMNLLSVSNQDLKIEMSRQTVPESQLNAYKFPSSLTKSSQVFLGDDEYESICPMAEGPLLISNTPIYSFM